MKLFVPLPPNFWENEEKKERERIKRLKVTVHSAFEELEEVLEDELYKRVKQGKLCYPIEEMLYDVHSILEDWDGLDDDTIFRLRGEYRKTFYKYEINHTH